jgi:hypothetical protein
LTLIATIDLPLPLVGASPNSHAHWRVRAKATKQMREHARLLGLPHKQKEPRPLRISATFYMGKTLDRRYRPLDTANAIGALKPYVDGLVDAGIVPDDSHRWISWGKVTLLRNLKEHQGRSGVTLTLEADPFG